MKRYDLKPRPCPCNGTCQKCDGMIKPISEYETQYKFDRRKYCCVFCPKVHAHKVGRRHTKKTYVPAKKTTWDLYLMGRLGT